MISMSHRDNIELGAQRIKEYIDEILKSLEAIKKQTDLLVTQSNREEKNDR